MGEVDWRALPDAVYLLDASANLIDLNPAARAQLDCGAEQAPTALQSALDPDRSLAARLHALPTGASSLRIEARDRRGRAVPLSISVARTPERGFLLVARDAAPWLHAERELQRRLDFERLITTASARLIRSAAEDIDAAIVEVLASVGGMLGVDRAYVFVIEHGAGTQSNTHEWVGPGISAEAHNLQDIPLTVFPWLLSQLLRDQLIAVDRVATLPPEAGNERAEFEREGIQSILIVPLWHGTTLHGFVGFDSVRRPIDWGEDYVIGLRLMAQMLSGAMESHTLALRLQAMAFHDPLTGLANRKLLEDRFDEALRGQAAKQAGGVVLALVDLDDFKRVNDGHGHAIGDLLLCEVARRLRDTVRDSDTVARLGGDEFVLVVEDDDPAALERVGARLVEVGRRPFELAGLRLEVGLSAGLVFARAGGRARDELMRRADAAMYRAKQAGKNRWDGESLEGD
jgi:diguanylate cyclase (GGDEF)-like protein